MPKNDLLAAAETLDLEALETRHEFLEVTCDYGGDCENTSNRPK